MWGENYPGHVAAVYQKLGGGSSFPLCFVIPEQPFVKQIEGENNLQICFLTIKHFFLQ